MAPLSRGPARTLPAKWCRYLGPGLNAACIRVALSGWPALHIGDRVNVNLFKNRKKKCFSYHIYGFAINRIYKKIQYVYLGFSVGSRSSRNYFSNVKTKAVASDSRKKNSAQCRQSRHRL